MQATRAHAHRAIQEIARRRHPDLSIEKITSVDLLTALSYKPRDYAKVYGQVASLMDATCVAQELPLFGKLIKFERTDDEIGAAWSNWRPHMDEIEAAVLARRWSDEDIQRILNNLPEISAKRWWRQNENRSAELLQSALSVARRK